MKLRPDPENARRHDQHNKALVRKSLEEVGGGRSILVDGEGIVRAGNNVFEQASELGMRIRMVEADPDELIAVVRPDLTGEKAILAAFYDNRAGELGRWNPEVLQNYPKIASRVFEIGQIETLLDKIRADSTGPDPQAPAAGETPGSPAPGPIPDPGNGEKNISDSPIGSIRYLPKLNKKRTVRFLSIRSWRTETKPEDLSALKEFKANCDQEIIDRVAGEFYDLLKDLLKRPDLACITHPPQGASKGERHFATELAVKIADLSGAEYFKAFEDRPRHGSSHPRNWNERGELTLRQNPPRSICILVDDVATSGSTLEKCAAALGAAAVVIPIAWIYEDSA